ncbi:hypothetical protein M422DRAFT_241018 [Sphaerobolus stellatus SS14]|nr:hypothetical protein M422DRAFT_241014 [Sphaerobolus stellatus SS14]KIJ54931.1 hypothetical protein M422DRAFT_241018 [Sphaerobolus stellatus SS14]
MVPLIILYASITAVVVSSLFLNLREAAHRTRSLGDSLWEMTMPFGDGNTRSGASIHFASLQPNDTENQSHNVHSRSRSTMIGFEDFTVELPAWGEELSDEHEEMEETSVLRST